MGIDVTATRKSFSPTDGVVLSYLEAGAGRPMLLVAGWSQTVAEFRQQIDFFAGRYHIYALDHRGFGESRSATTDVRVDRLAADLHEFITALDLRELVVLAHGMGCAVIWSHWQQFGGSAIKQLVLVDQPAAMTQSPLWSAEERAEFGASYTPEAASAIATGVAGLEGLDFTAGALAAMFSPAMPEPDAAWFLSENLKTPRPVAGRLFLDAAQADWRDVVRTIDVPTLVTAGEASLYPVAGPVWVAAHIVGAQLRVFTGQEKGSHFIFWENSQLFNSVVLAFLENDAVGNGRP